MSSRARQSNQQIDLPIKPDKKLKHKKQNKTKIFTRFDNFCLKKYNNLY
jgi:hypothetical protein